MHLRYQGGRTGDVHRAIAAAGVAANDESRNNVVFGVLAFGEGWPNGHHAFPTSALHGLRRWEIDINYLIIRGMKLIGLARNVRHPTPERLAAKMQ